MRTMREVLENLVKELIWLIQENQLTVPRENTELIEELRKLGECKSLQEAIDLVSKSTYLKALCLSLA